MRTLHITNSTGQIIDLTESLVNQIQSLYPYSETEKKFKDLLFEIANTIASDLLVIQDLLITGNELNGSALTDLIGDYVETFN